MFSFLKKKEETVTPITCADNEIIAIADAKQVPIETVKDEVFAQKMMGDGIAFELKSETICAPVSGTLTVLFPTGHAFGITTADGVELLCHIGINTVESKGEGFKILSKQGNAVKAGDPIVKADLKALSKKYDMTTMLIVTNANGKTVAFSEPQEVTRGQVVGKIS